MLNKQHIANISNEPCESEDRYDGQTPEIWNWCQGQDPMPVSPNQINGQRKDQVTVCECVRSIPRRHHRGSRTAEHTDHNDRGGRHDRGGHDPFMMIRRRYACCCLSVESHNETQWLCITTLRARLEGSPPRGI